MLRIMKWYCDIKRKLKMASLLTQAFLTKINYRKRNFVQNGNILVISDGFLGDGLLNAYSVIKKLQEHYKTISLICNPAEWTAYEMTLDISNIRCIKYDYKTDYGFVKLKNVVKENISDTNYEYVIVLSESNRIWMAYIILKTLAREKVALFYRGMPERWYNKIKFYFFKNIVDRGLAYSQDVWKMTANKKLIGELGLEEDRTKIVPIPKQSSFMQLDDNYITVTVDSNNKIRRWSHDKFIRLIEMLLNKYGYDIILLGNKLSDFELKQYEIAFADIPRVKIYINKTDVKMFVELLRNSQYHIGVDSGSIHVAASVGTQSFCLTGKWDGNRFFPYQLEEHTDVTIEPICIFWKDVDNLPCYGCAYKGTYGWKNRKCYVRCKKGKGCLCLEQIKVDDVIKVINKTIKGK